MFDPKMYKETFAQVQASEETLSEVLKMTKKQNHNYGRRFTRMLVIAAVVTAMLATTAFAYVGFTQYENPMQMLDAFFGSAEYKIDEGGYVRTETYYDQEWDIVEPTVEHVPVDTRVAEEDVAPYVSGVGQTVTYQDYTLTVEAHLYDSATECGVIYYTLENPNGVRGYDLQLDGEVWWPGGELIVMRGCHGKNYIIEEETTDTCLSVAHYYCGIYEEYIEACFSAQEEGLMLPLTDGGGMDALAAADGQIAISPVAIRITVTDMEFLCWKADGTYSSDKENHIDYLAIRNKDGTEFIIQSDEPYMNNTMYALITYDGNVVSYAFNRLIDIDQVEAVIINDVEYTDIQPMTQAQRDAVPETLPEQPAATEPANP